MDIVKLLIVLLLLSLLAPGILHVPWAHVGGFGSVLLLVIILILVFR